MRIAVAVKPVPLGDDRTVGDPWDLGRARVMDPCGRRAVAQACELAAAVGDGTVIALAAAPVGADAAVRDAVAWARQMNVGCDGVAVDDPALGTADSLEVARALATLIARDGGVDLVLVGRAAVDVGSGHVGPQLAELLGLPFVASARYLSVTGSTLHVRSQRDDGWAQVDVDVPAVVGCAEDLIAPCPTTPAAALAADRRRATAGSPRRLRVGATRPAAPARQPRLLRGSLPAQARDAVDVLLERGALAPTGPGAVATPTRAGGDPIVVVLEPSRPGTARELLGHAAALAGATLGPVVALSPQPEPDRAAAWGADTVVHLDGSELEEDVAVGVAAWVRRTRPALVLAPATTWGSEVAARAAARLDAGLVGGAVGVDVDDAAQLRAWSRVLGGGTAVPVRWTSPLRMVTVRPGALPRPEPRAGPLPEQRAVTLGRRSRVRVRSRHRDDDLELLAGAARVVGVGVGVPRDEYATLAPLLEALSAQLAATRPVTRRGWLPHARLVGLEGRAIAPRLYVGVGLDGAPEHLVGLREAGTLLGIHEDPDAPLLAACDLGLLGPWRAVVPALVAELAGAGVGAARA